METQSIYEKGLFNIYIDEKAKAIKLKEFSNYDLNNPIEIELSYDEEPLFRFSFLMREYKRAAFFFAANKELSLEELETFSFIDEELNPEISTFGLLRKQFSAKQYTELKRKAKSFFIDYTLLPILEANLNSGLKARDLIKITSNEGIPTVYGKVLEAPEKGIVTIITDTNEFIELHYKTPIHKISLDDIPTSRFYRLDQYFEAEFNKLIKERQKFIDRINAQEEKKTKEELKNKEKAEREEASIKRQHEDLIGQIEEMRIKAENKMEKGDYKAIREMILTFKKDIKEASKESIEALQNFISKLKIEISLRRKPITIN